MSQLKISKNGTTTLFPLTEAIVTIGRSPKNSLTLEDKAASSKHVRLSKDKSGWRIEDLNSSNGTLVNGKSIQAAVLSHGDMIHIGATEIYFEETGDPDPAPVQEVKPKPIPRTSKMSMSGSSHGSSILQSFMPEALSNQDDFENPLMNSIHIDDTPLEDSEDESNFAFLGIDSDQAMKTMVLGSEELAKTPTPGRKDLAEAKLRLMQEVSEKLVRIFDSNQLMNEIMSIVIRQTRADRGVLCLLDDQRQPVPIAAHGLHEGEQVKISRTVLRRVLEQRTGVIIDLTGNSSNMLQSLEEMQVCSTLCAPLWIGDEIIGLLSLDSMDEEKIFTPDDLELLLAVAHQAAIGIERGKLNQMVESEQQVRAYLSKYLDHRIVEQISSQEGDEDPLAPAERIVTVLFSDIVSFTKMSENLEPAELAKFIGEYLTAMTEIIFSHGGTIDKYIGDAVMALFGAPIPNEDSAAEAILAALEMRERLKSFPSPPNVRGPLRASFGINTGLVVVGNLGSTRRMEYTAIGDAVNVASRLETFARPNEICIDEETYKRTAGILDVEEIGTIDVKNRAQPILVYKVLGAK